MRHTKKGDLALSTNAIVVLIIAVIVLGLIITFITQGFGAVEDRFLSQAESLPEPVRPTASKPVSLSPDTIVGSPGDDFGMKVSVLNKETDQRTVNVTVAAPSTGNAGPSCAALDTDVESNSRIIESREVGTFTIVGQIADDATPGRSLCSLTVSLTQGTSSKIYTADLVFNVRD